MSAAEALQAAQNAGVEIGIDGDDLVLEASAPPPAAILDLLSRHKAEVLAVLAATARENKLLAPTPLSERGEQPAEGEPGHEHPCAPVARIERCVSALLRRVRPVCRLRLWGPPKSRTTRPLVLRRTSASHAPLRTLHK